MTAAYLGRGFGEPRSLARKARINMFEVATRRRIATTAERACVVNDFSVVRTDDGPDDAIERAWSEREARALQLVSRVNPSVGLTDDEAFGIKIIVALHLARSFPMQRAVGAAWERHVAPLPDDVTDQPDLVQAFEQDMGRPPRPGEVREVLSSAVKEWSATNEFFVHQQVEHFNKIVQYLAPRATGVSLLASPAGEYLITSDTPVHLIDMNAGVAAALADSVRLGEEDLIIMPLSRRHIAHIGDHAIQPVIAAPRALEFNQIQIGNAHRFVYAHPDTNLGAVAPDLASFTARHADGMQAG